MAKRTLQEALDAYGAGLFVSECGEALQHVGNAGRFAFDTPERGLATSRELLADEIGDIFAAVDWMAEAGVIDWMRVAARREAKNHKLRDPSAKTNDGRPIAPQIVDRRPTNCRNRLRDEGFPYPKSGCSACGDFLARGCPTEARQ